MAFFTLILFCTKIFTFLYQFCFTPNIFYFYTNFVLNPIFYTNILLFYTNFFSINFFKVFLTPIFYTKFRKKLALYNDPCHSDSLHTDTSYAGSFTGLCESCKSDYPTYGFYFVIFISFFYLRLPFYISHFPFLNQR